MSRLLVLSLALITAACATSDTGGEDEPVLTGTWRGTLIPLDGGRSLPARLTLSASGAGLIAGSSRVSGSDARSRNGRIEFSVESFPVTPSMRRSLSCSLSEQGPQTLNGFCRAATARYELRLVRVLSGARS